MASQPTEPQSAPADEPGYPGPREEAAFDQADGSHEIAPSRPEDADAEVLEDAETYRGSERAEPASSEAPAFSAAPGEAWLATGEAGPDAGPASEVATEPGAFDHVAWLELFPSLSLSGLTRNLAAHCMVEHDDGEALQLRLDPGQAAMNAEVHVERVRKALAAAGIERRISIDSAELPAAIETPKSRSDREARERHAQAVEALRGDPHIQELEQAFSARLLEQTVAPQAAQAGTPAAR